MSDSVKFIFKTLIKVPVIIAVAYGVFNIFAFCFIYFKMLGLSYVVMQTAVENNYLPQKELGTLYDYVHQMDEDIEMIENASIIVGIDEDGNYLSMDNDKDTSPEYDNDARRKQQYGKQVTVGVTCDYIFIWPLDYRAADDGVAEKTQGLDGNTGAVDTGFSPDLMQEAAANGSAIRSNNAIQITYTVPGLKYYPDLLY